MKDSTTQPYDYANIDRIRDPEFLSSFNEKYIPMFGELEGIALGEFEESYTFTPNHESFINHPAVIDWLYHWKNSVDEASLEELLVLFSMVSPAMHPQEGKRGLITEPLREGILQQAYSLHSPSYKGILFPPFHFYRNEHFETSLEADLIERILSIITKGTYSPPEYQGIEAEEKQLDYRVYFIQLIPRTVCDLLGRLKEIKTKTSPLTFVVKELSKLDELPSNLYSKGMKWWFTKYALRGMTFALDENGFIQTKYKQTVKKSLTTKNYHLLWRDLLDLSYKALLLKEDETDKWYLNNILNYLEAVQKGFPFGESNVVVPSWKFSFEELDSILDSKNNLNELTRHWTKIKQAYKDKEITFTR